MSKHNFEVSKCNGAYIIKKATKSDKTLQSILSTLDLDKYIILKGSRAFRVLTYEQLIEESYCNYILIEKDYCDNLDLWIKFTNEHNRFKFLDKPFPPFNPYDKIKIIHYEKEG